ncbi:MAG: DUF1269 domain-containing protein [Thermoleophilia bacterium]|nr:DUF1269 domain-containing protein [Thermoleophilia bacterium]
MTESDGFIVYAGQYPSLEAAKDDFVAIKALHKADFVGHYESALFTKEEGGKVKIVDTDETARAHGAVGGAIAGAVLGVIFPPSLLVMAASGGAVGAVLGHVAKGMPRGDIKEVGDMLDEGEAGIIFVGEATVEAGVEKLMKKASKIMKKEIQADADEMKKTLDQAVRT